jgi:prolyl-tRNA editing enzyme YbaK/EbsC (Cys-tRNA(Pro) deacylase)
MNDDVEVDAAVRKALEQLGVDFKLVPCDPALADTASFCQAYGYSLSDSANTIVVMGKANPPAFVACVVLADTRLDVNRAVKQRLGVRRASFASAEETAALTGMMIGGVTVFALPTDLPIWVDERVMSREQIILGGGSRSWKVVARPEILRRLPNVEIVPALALERAPLPTPENP